MTENIYTYEEVISTCKAILARSVVMGGTGHIELYLYLYSGVKEILPFITEQELCGYLTIYIKEKNEKNSN